MSARKVFSDFADVMAPERVSWRNIRSRATAAERECDQLRADNERLRGLVKGLRKSVKNDDTEWLDANIIRLLLDRLDNPHPSGLLDGEGQQL